MSSFGAERKLTLRSAASGLPEAVQKPQFSKCAWKVLLDIVIPKTKNTDDRYRRKTREKTMLRVLGSRTFLHSLAPISAIG